MSQRERLPPTRDGLTHHFEIMGELGQIDGYFTVSFYADGRPGELFIVLAKEGSTISGWADSFASAVSVAFQRGMTVEEFVSQYKDKRFEPSGQTRNPRIGYAKSVPDYIARWFELTFEQAGSRQVSQQEEVK